MGKQKIILVIGATGRQGAAVTRHLLKAGSTVRTLTRNSNSTKAKILQNSGAEVVQGDLNEPDQIKHFFNEVYGVFSVQNPWITGLEKETEHGKLIASLAAKAGVQHLVYSSAGLGKPESGVPHFESKMKIEQHIKKIGLPYTILRFAGFMELMSDKEFVPSLVIWNVVEKMLGDDFPLSWIAVNDVGAITAKVFANPDKYIGKELNLMGDIKSIKECKEIYRNIHGSNPFRIPAPVWLFKLMQNDLYKMFEWVKEGELNSISIEETRKIHPGLMKVEDWMRKTWKPNHPDTEPIKDF